MFSIQVRDGVMRVRAFNFAFASQAFSAIRAQLIAKPVVPRVPRGAVALSKRNVLAHVHDESGSPFWISIARINLHIPGRDAPSLPKSLNYYDCFSTHHPPIESK